MASTSKGSEPPTPSLTPAPAPAPDGGPSDGGHAVVRIKPLGVGGGGGEASAEEEGAVGVEAQSDGGVLVTSGNEGGREKLWTYPAHVVAPDDDNAALYGHFMPRRVEAFLAGTNVNVMCYGQTGSGKTHTMFGPPGIMDRAAGGEFGVELSDGYGLCPRGLISIVSRLDELRQAGVGVRVRLNFY